MRRATTCLQGIVIWASVAMCAHAAGWMDFSIPLDDGPHNATIQDVSFLLDPPAGNHGFLQVVGDQFSFEDGTPFKVFGTNLAGQSCFPPHTVAERFAARMAKYGINCVRFHFMDKNIQGVGIFDLSGNDTQHLDPGQMDKLCYLIHQLRQRGIYANINLCVARKFLANDGVVDYALIPRWGAKNVIANARIQELAEIYAGSLLTWFNPYTGLRLCDDPAVAFVELLNENSLIIGWAGGKTHPGDPYSIPVYYQDELDSLFNQWLIGKYGTTGALLAAWDDGTGTALDPGETIGNVGRKKADDMVAQGYSNARHRDTARFHGDMDIAYWNRLYTFLRTLGVRCPINVSNNHYRLYHQRLVSEHSDYVDNHGYWDHPDRHNNDSVHNLSAIVTVGEFPTDIYDALEESLAVESTKGIPYVVSETNHCWPNEYRTESTMTVFYGALQGWNGIYNFNWHADQSGTADHWDENFIYKLFLTSSDPAQLANFPVMALAFLRGDIAESSETIELAYTEDEVFDDYRVPWTENFGVQGGFDVHHALVRKIRRADFNAPAVKTKADYYAQYGLTDLTSPYVSTTSELSLGSERLVVNAPRIQGAVGQYNGITETGCANIAITSATDFASVLLASKDGADIANSAEMFLTATSKCENTGQVWDPTHTYLTDIGTAPTRVQKVIGTITLTGIADLDLFDVYNTDNTGAVTTRIPPIVQNSSMLQFAIADSVWYAIVIDLKGDLNTDGDVDTNDFLTFANCFNGSLNPPQTGCVTGRADLDRDGDVDSNDFLTFSNCFNGSLNPPGCP